MPSFACRVIVAVLNSFHFDVGAAAPGLAGGPPESDPSKDDAMDLEGGAVEEGVVKDADELDDDDAVLNGDGDGEQKESMGSAVTVQKIHDSICTSVLPELQKCLVKRVSITFLNMLFDFAWHDTAVRLFRLASAIPVATCPDFRR